MAVVHSPIVADLDYTPSDVTSHSNQRGDLYVPDQAIWPQPPGGYPCVVTNNFGGFVSSTRQGTLAESNGFPAWKLVQDGYCVFDISVTKSGTDYSSTPPLVGLGLFHPPASTGVGTSGNYENVNYPMCVKDAAYAVSYLRKNAANVGASGVKINSDMVGWYGTSAGLYIGLWLFGTATDRMRALGVSSTDTQYAASSKPNFLCGTGVMVSFVAFDQQTITGAFFPTAADFPAYASETQATFCEDANALYLEQSSWVFYGDVAAAAGVPIILAYTDLNVSTNFSTPQTVSDSETASHSAWSGFVLATALQAYGNVKLGIYVTASMFSLYPTLVDASMATSGMALLWITNEMEKILAQGYGTVTARVRGGQPLSVTPFMDGPCTTYSGTLAGGAATIAVPANGLRRRGVTIYNAGPAGVASRLTVKNDLPANAADGFMLDTPLTASGSLRELFIPGQGVVYALARTGVTTSFFAVEH